MKHNDPKYTICYNAKKFCCEDISLIENYDQMIANYTQKWCCHHRREIDEHKSRKQLIAEGHYYNRPACELIFMTDSDHKSLHTKLRMNGKPKSEEQKKKMSDAAKCRYLEKRWWNNGEKQVFCKECPGPEYKPGWLKK